MRKLISTCTLNGSLAVLRNGGNQVFDFNGGIFQ